MGQTTLLLFPQLGNELLSCRTGLALGATVPVRAGLLVESLSKVTSSHGMLGWCVPGWVFTTWLLFRHSESL